MIFDDHLAEMFDVWVLRRLLAELAECDLLVVFDNRQGNDARLELLSLGAGLSRLAGLARLAGARLPRLSLCEQKRGAAKQHHYRTRSATKCNVHVFDSYEETAMAATRDLLWNSVCECTHHRASMVPPISSRRS